MLNSLALKWEVDSSIPPNIEGLNFSTICLKKPKVDKKERVNSVEKVKNLKNIIYWWLF